MKQRREEPNMWKKVLSLFLILALLFVLTGCGNSQNSQPIQTEEQAQKSIQNVSQDVSGISDSLNDINSALG